MLKKVSITLIAIGALCMLAFNLIGSTVDAQGVLHEPFALIPLGWMFAITGVVLYLYAYFHKKGQS